MMSQIANFVMDNFLLILAVLVALITLLFYLLFKEKKERKEEKKRLAEPQFVDAITFKLQSHILNNIQSLIINTRELGFAYESDYIQSIITDIPKAISYFKQHYNDYTLDENFVSILPCIPENLVTPHQMIAATFMKGKCTIPLEKMRNVVEVPQKPYWIFLVSTQKIEDPKCMFYDRARSGLTCNELIRAATQYEQIWRERANQLISNGCLVEGDLPITFRYNLIDFFAELSVYTEKKHFVRDYYLVMCSVRTCFR